MPRFIWDTAKQAFVPEDEYVWPTYGTPSSNMSFPQIMKYGEHVSPIDGTVISSRTAQKEHEKIHRVRQLDPSEAPKGMAERMAAREERIAKKAEAKHG